MGSIQSESRDRQVSVESEKIKTRLVSMFGLYLA